jgi:hypothetical protein
MAERAVELFTQLRPQFLARLDEVREALDESYQGLELDTARERFEILVDRYEGYLDKSDLDGHRRFLRRWLALRLAEGRSPESVLHVLVAVGDVLVQVSRANLPPAPATLDLVRELQRLTYVTARLVVDILAEDLERKSASVRRGGA